jgi:hypothetical protein
MTRWTRLAVDSHGRIHSLLYDINSINNEACKLKGPDAFIIYRIKFVSEQHYKFGNK